MTDVLNTKDTGSLLKLGATLVADLIMSDDCLPLLWRRLKRHLKQKIQY